jgi:hypothetical protein
MIAKSRPRRSAAADVGDQGDFTVGVERGEIGVLEDFAVDRHRHTLLDLAPGPRKLETSKNLVVLAGL